MSSPIPTSPQARRGSLQFQDAQHVAWSQRDPFAARRQHGVDLTADPFAHLRRSSIQPLLDDASASPSPARDARHFSLGDISLNLTTAGPRRFSIHDTLLATPADLRRLDTRRFSVQDTYRPYSPTTSKDFTDRILHSYQSWRDSAGISPSPLTPASPASATPSRRASLVPPSSHARYSAKLRDRLSKQTLAYWKALLDDQIPCAFPTPAAPHDLPTTSAYVVNLHNPRLLFRSCALAGFTTPTLFQAAWALVVSAYCTTHDVCFAYEPPARDVPLEGPYMHFLYRKLAIDNKKSCKDFLRNVHNSHLDALQHQGCSQADVEATLGARITTTCNTALTIKISRSADKAPLVTVTDEAFDRQVRRP